MAKVYLETSFFSACGEYPTSPKLVHWRDQSRQWWVHQRNNYQIFHSAEVVRELDSPNFRGRQDALALTAEAKLLQITPEVRGLAKLFVREKVMPGPDDAGDAIHLAVAIYHQMDYLITWNQKHPANRNKIPHLREVCRRVGYAPPDITTPEQLWLLSPEE